jgi:hypothetical protein
MKMKNIILALCVIVMQALSGCTFVSCDRVFPKLTWYWSKEAKRCRGEKIQSAVQPAEPQPLVSMENSSGVVILPPQVTLTPDPNDPNAIAVNYSAGMDPSLFEWRAEASPDMRRWFYFYQFENSSVIYFTKFRPNTFVRLVGQPFPSEGQP